MFQCQNRGTAKFNRPQESSGITADNLEHESDKSPRNNRVREIVNVANVNNHRKYRFRSKVELDDDEKDKTERILPSNHKESPVDEVLPLPRKRPVRIGRRRLTTPTPSIDIPMVVPTKVNQEDNQNKQRETGDDDQKLVISNDQKLVISNIDSDKVDKETNTTPENVESVKNSTESVPEVNYTRSSPSNATRITTNVTSSTSTRISIRKGNRYQANASGKVEAISTETTTQRINRRPIIRSTEKSKIELLDPPTTPLPAPLSRGTARSSIKIPAKGKPDELEDLEDENYPEHFKLLLKASYQANLSTTVPTVKKETKFQNFKSRKVVPYRGYKQSSSTSTTVNPVIDNEPSNRVNFERVNRNDKRSKNVSIESNDVYVKDLDLTKENFNLVKETNYPEPTTTSVQFSSHNQKEKIYKVTTFKPAFSKLLTRNQSYKYRGPATLDTASNVPQNSANQAPVTIKEVRQENLFIFSIPKLKLKFYRLLHHRYIDTAPVTKVTIISN